jgi:hypothetical protein
MAGGLLQIVAYGAQDLYLTGNPQITFFKTVYRRHTNFSIESIKQTFNGTANFGQEVSTTIQRNADLISRTYLQTTLPSIDISNGITSGNYKAFRWLNWIGHVLIKTAEIRIGGQKIDKHYGEWLHIWNELSQNIGKQPGYAEMVGNVPKLTQIYSSSNTSTSDTCETGEYTLYIPLQFWFCRNPGMALPLIALQYHDIVINIEFRTLNECIWATAQNTATTYVSSTGNNVIASSSLSKTNLYVDYIYLDVDERRRFAQVAHEYLIEQLQYTGEETLSSSSNSVKLNFTHPVKELIWVIQPTNFVNNDYTQSRGGHQYFNYTDMWDYTNFTGTPEPSSGSGMIGGKTPQNLFYGLPSVKVKGNLNKNNNYSSGWATNLTSVTNSNAGYNDVSDYTASLTDNSYGNRTIENLLGSGIIEPTGVNAINHNLWNLNNNTTYILDSGDNPTSKAKLILNGNDRISEREGKYFNLIQPYQHHTNCPAPGINVYSFALTPEDHQPSGTCNFSRIDNASLSIDLTTNAISTTYNSGNVKIRVYAINYNILRIMSGMGGLAYSN